MEKGDKNPMSSLIQIFMLGRVFFPTFQFMLWSHNCHSLFFSILFLQLTKHMLFTLFIANPEVEERTGILPGKGCKLDHTAVC